MVYLYSVLLVAISLLIIWVLILTLRVQKFQRIQKLLLEGEEIDLSTLIKNFTEGENKLKLSIDRLSNEHYKITEMLQGAIQKTAVVRFDAFEDAGGKLSFAAAFLNEHGDGVVLSAINGRSESRTYAKPVKAGSSIFNLSKEEEDAINRAMKYQQSSTN